MIINGKIIADEILCDLKDKIKKVSEPNKRPFLAIILVGKNFASSVYVKNKIKKAAEIGICAEVFQLDENITENALSKYIEKLNFDIRVHGILVQLPLPSHLSEEVIINSINPLKDVDGFHDTNKGKLFSGKSDCYIPCTPLGCLILIKKALGNNLTGKNALIIGRSNIVGKPMGILLLKENCTITFAHSKTNDLERLSINSDIIVVAIGIPKFLKLKHVNQKSIIIDVGINKISSFENSNKLVGDADFENIAGKCKGITPVPGGVGPMTIACLMKNTLKAYEKQKIKA